MTTPEISRRCRACGASVRARAAFCPQCGARMGEPLPAMNEAAHDADSPSPTPASFYETPITRDVVEEQFSKWEASGTTQEDVPVSKSIRAEGEAGGCAASQMKNDVPLPTTGVRASSPEQRESSPARHPEGEPAARERPRGATLVEENLRPRVERLRDASMGVIEEASEDTGLRFVLIALALFLLFLLFFILNGVLK